MQALIERRGSGPWRYADLVGDGWTIDALQAAVDGGRILRVGRGVYAAQDNAADPRQGIRAALARVPEGVVSHESAGEVERLWLPIDARPGVHLTCAGASERTDAGLTIHGSRLPSEFVVERDGMRVTTIARTAVDLARGRSFPEALVVVDSAVRRLIAEGGVDLRVLRDPARRTVLTAPALERLHEAFASVWSWPGTVAVRGAIACADAGSESPHESRSRGWFLEAKLPLPVIAYEVWGASGKRYYADFGWPDRRVLGEADGFAKYLNDPAALRAERVRQQDLEDAGWSVVRWSTADPRPAVIRRVARALGLE